MFDLTDLAAYAPSLAAAIGVANTALKEFMKEKNEGKHRYYSKNDQKTLEEVSNKLDEVIELLKRQANC